MVRLDELRQRLLEELRTQSARPSRPEDVVAALLPIVHEAMAGAFDEGRGAGMWEWEFDWSRETPNPYDPPAASGTRVS